MKSLLLIIFAIASFSPAIAQEDLFYEDFSGVLVGSPYKLQIGGYDLNDFTRDKGWETDLSIAFASGYCVLYPVDTGVLTTPVVDLSGNSGNFNLIITAATGSFGVFTVSKNTMYAELIDNDGIVERSKAVTFESNEFVDYTFLFSKGSVNSRLRIVYNLNYDNNILFIDKIRIGQYNNSGIVHPVIGSDAGAQVEWFDLQGRRVDNPSRSGLYICRQGSVVEKIIVK